MATQDGAWLSGAGRSSSASPCCSLRLYLPDRCASGSLNRPARPSTAKRSSPASLCNCARPVHATRPQEWIMECFLLVFGGSLLQDVLRFPTTMGTMLILHHAACLVGMAVARLAPGPDWPHLFPFFFCGCTALEIGSGTCNLYWLQLLSPRQRSPLRPQKENHPTSPPRPSGRAAPRAALHTCGWCRMSCMRRPPEAVSPAWPTWATRLTSAVRVFAGAGRSCTRWR